MESPADLEGFTEMEEAQKEEVKGLIQEFVSLRPSTKKAAGTRGPVKSPVKVVKEGVTHGDSLSSVGKRVFLTVLVRGSTCHLVSCVPAAVASTSSQDDRGAAGSSSSSVLPDNSFHKFCQLCMDLERESGYNAKTKRVSDFLKLGVTGGREESKG